MSILPATSRSVKPALLSLCLLALATAAAAQPAPSGPRFRIGDDLPFTSEATFAVAADRAGGFLLAWRATDGVTVASRPLARRMEASGALGEPFAIDTPPVQTYESAPRLAVLGPGRFAAVWEARAGDAALGTDFAVSSGRAVFADGDAQPKRIEIPIFDDAQAEGDETFEVVLSNPGGGAGLGPITRATVEIRDDDTPPPLLAGAGPVFPVASFGDDHSSLCCSSVTPLATGSFVLTWLDVTSRGFRPLDTAPFFKLYNASGALPPT